MYANITIFIDEHPSGKGFVISTLGYHSDDPDNEAQPDDDTGWDSEEADTKAEALKTARFMGKRMVDDKEAKSVTVLFRGGDIGGCEAKRGKKATCKLSPRRWEQTGKLGGAPTGLKITLREVVVGKGEETPKFQAVLVINGKKVAHVRNDGQGGCDVWFWHDHDAKDPFQAHARQWVRQHRVDTLPGEEGDALVHSLLPAKAYGEAPMEDVDVVVDGYSLRDLFVGHIDEMYEYPNEGPDALRLLPGMKTLIRDTGPEVKRDLDWARKDDTWEDFDPESFEITLRALREQVLNASKAQVRQYINELDRYIKR